MTPPDDQELRRMLVGLGVTLKVERYAGQGQTGGAHEFADKALPIIKAIENRIVRRVLRAFE